MNDIPWYAWFCLTPLAVFLVWLFFASIKAESDHGKEVKASAETFAKWQAWALAEPDPAGEIYKPWNDGGGERFLADLEHYRREHPAPVVIERKSTTERRQKGW